MLIFEALSDEKASFLLEAGGPCCSAQLTTSSTRGTGCQLLLEVLFFPRGCLNPALLWFHQNNLQERWGEAFTVVG